MVPRGRVPRVSVSRRLSREISPENVTRSERIESPPLTSPDTGTIIVVERRALIRDCLVRCLRHANSEYLVLPFATLEDWLAAPVELAPPAVVILSIPAARAADIQIEREFALLTSKGIDIPVVVISDTDDHDSVVAVLERGVRGFIPTSVTLDVAVEAMHLIEAGGTFVPASSLVPRNRPEAAHGGSHTNGLFTARQLAVLAALREGKANKRIAYDLNMREGTVKVHIRNIMKKLNARNRTEVAIRTNALFDLSGSK